MNMKQGKKKNFTMDNKHLMTGPKGNRFPEAKPRGTLRVKGKQNSQFPVPTENRTIHGFLHKICHCFKGAPRNHMRVERRELASEF